MVAFADAPSPQPIPSEIKKMLLRRLAFTTCTGKDLKIDSDVFYQGTSSYNTYDLVQMVLLPGMRNPLEQTSNLVGWSRWEDDGSIVFDAGTDGSITLKRDAKGHAIGEYVDGAGQKKAINCMPKFITCDSLNKDVIPNYDILIGVRYPKNNDPIGTPLSKTPTLTVEVNKIADFLGTGRPIEGSSGVGPLTLKSFDSNKLNIKFDGDGSTQPIMQSGSLKIEYHKENGFVGTLIEGANRQTLTCRLGY
jgi:hypothetical protein